MQTAYWGSNHATGEQIECNPARPRGGRTFNTFPALVSQMTGLSMRFYRDRSHRLITSASFLRCRCGTAKEEVAMASQEPSAADRRVTPRFPNELRGRACRGQRRGLSYGSRPVDDGMRRGDPDAGPGSRRPARCTGPVEITRCDAPQTQGAILPVLLCNLRLEDDRLRYGLRFQKLSARQTRSLISVMDALI